jgi:undecaprenyl-diphosphatase
MLQFLDQIDKDFLLFLNGLHCEAMDFIMYWVSDKFVWIPLYLFFLLKLIKKYGKQSWIVILTIVLLITLSDQISYFFKNFLMRPRPTHDAVIGELVHIVNNYRGGKFGFFSGHATSSFALAVFLIRMSTFRHKAWTPILLFWAVLVSYSRIYLGVHYPFDVLTGAIVGSGLAWIISHYCLKVLSSQKNA